jgi:hypothetical protein
MEHIGWSRGNALAFITATTLARHRIRTRGVTVKPFTFGSYTLPKIARRVNPCYLVGSFEGGEIDTLVKMNVKATVIGKIFDEKYSNRMDRFRVGRVIVYPVPRTDKLGGYEYLATLLTYFNLTTEVEFFRAMLSRKDKIARVFSVTDTWIEAFELLTSFEIIENPDVEDIDKVIEYIKRKHNYEERLDKMKRAIRENVLTKGNRYVVVSVGIDDPRKYIIPAHDAYPNAKIVAIVSRVPEANVYKVVVSCKKRCNGTMKRTLKSKLNAEIRGGIRRFSVRIPVSTPLGSIIETLSMVFERN